jgi:protein-tyrosine-phosphatase
VGNRLPSRFGLREDWQIPDPKALPAEEFRQVRDMIEEKVKTLLEGI